MHKGTRNHPIICEFCQAHRPVAELTTERVKKMNFSLTISLKIPTSEISVVARLQTSSIDTASTTLAAQVRASAPQKMSSLKSRQNFLQNPNLLRKRFRISHT